MRYETPELTTAFARRLVALSWAFHHNQLDDSVIEGYLDELVDACQGQLAKVKLTPTFPCEAVSEFLEGVLDVIESFDRWRHEETHLALASMECSLLRGLAHLDIGVAA